MPCPLIQYSPLTVKRHQEVSGGQVARISQEVDTQETRKSRKNKSCHGYWRVILLAFEGCLENELLILLSLIVEHVLIAMLYIPFSLK